MGVNNLSSSNPLNTGSEGQGSKRLYTISVSTLNLQEFLLDFLGRNDKGCILSALEVEFPELKGISNLSQGRYIQWEPGEKSLYEHARDLVVTKNNQVVLLFEASDSQVHYTELFEICQNQNFPLVGLSINSGLFGRKTDEEYSFSFPRDIAVLRTLPNLTLMSFSGIDALNRNLDLSIKLNGFQVIRCASFPWSTSIERDWNEVDFKFEFTSLEKGDRGAIIATGRMVPEALLIWSRLSERGMKLEIIEANTLFPMPVIQLNELTTRHDKLFILEDHSIQGGLGTIVSDALIDNSSCRLIRLGWPDSQNLTIAKTDFNSLRKQLNLDVEGIIHSIESIITDQDPKLVGSQIFDPAHVDVDRARKYIEEVKNLQLSPWFLELIEEYVEVGHRDSFLWLWVRRGVEVTTLSCVPKNNWNHVCDSKALGVLFDVLIDDIADGESDSQFLEKLIAITRDEPVEVGHLSSEKQKYFNFTKKIWKLMWKRFSSYPRFNELSKVLRYDYRQLMNSMRYSILIKDHPFIMNVPEHDAYLPHNMHMVASGTVDVMASEDFDIEDLGRLRKVLLYAQYMGRIGNLVTTWEREIIEKDYSSGVFPLGLALGVLNVEDLQEGDPDKIREKIQGSDIEKRFLYRWQQLRLKILEQAPKIQSVDVEKLVIGLETLIQLHLGSRGLK